MFDSLRLQFTFVFSFLLHFMRPIYFPLMNISIHIIVLFIIMSALTT